MSTDLWQLKGIFSYLFPKCEWHIFVFDHVRYLSPHSKWEEDYPVEEKYWPKHWYIKRTKERHHECNTKRLCDWVPAKKRKLSSFSTSNHLQVKIILKCINMEDLSASYSECDEENALYLKACKAKRTTNK